jgi:hypothetical protein
MCTVSYKVPDHVVLDTDCGLSVTSSSHIFAKKVDICGGLVHCVEFFN